MIRQGQVFAEVDSADMNFSLILGQGREVRLYLVRRRKMARDLSGHF